MDKQTFTENILAAQDSLYRIAKSVLVCEADCEDAVQEAVLKAWEKRFSLRETVYFRTWLIRILLNECFRIRKSRQRFLALEEYTPLPEAEGWGGAPETAVDYDLQRAILELPVKLRTTLVLYYVEGYSVEETAGLLRIPRGTVKSRLSKGRSLLREKLSE